MKYKVSIAQIDSTLLNFKVNEEKIIYYMEKASKNESKMIVFPELTLSGYSLNKKYLNRDIEAKIRKSLKVIREKSKLLNLDTVISYPDIKGNRSYIASEYISKGATKAKHYKIYLANYAHCREHNNFNGGKNINVIKTDIGKIALLICEDAWHITTSVIAAQMGAEIIIVSSATSILDKSKIADIKYAWETISSAIGLSQTCYFIYCNRVGRERDLIFWGGSHIVSPNGKIVKKLSCLKEEFANLEIDMELVKKNRELTPLIYNENNKLNLELFKKLVHKNKD